MAAFTAEHYNLTGSDTFHLLVVLMLWLIGKYNCHSFDAKSLQDAITIFYSAPVLAFCFVFLNFVQNVIISVLILSLHPIKAFSKVRDL